MTSQIEGTQATLADLFDEEAGITVTNTDDVSLMKRQASLLPIQTTLKRCPTTCEHFGWFRINCVDPMVYQ